MKIYRKTMFNAIFCLLSAFFILVLSSCAAEENRNLQSPPGQQQAPAAMNEAVRAGDIVITASKTSFAQNVGGTYGQNATGRYIIVDLALKNEGKDSVTVNSTQFVLLKGDVEYDVDTLATTYANEAGKGFFLESINPGLEKKGKVVFDIPKDASGFELQFQSGLIGGTTIRIKLDK